MVVAAGRYRRLFVRVKAKVKKHRLLLQIKNGPVYSATSPLHSLNRPKVSITTKGGNGAQVRKFGPTIPENCAGQNPHQTVASIMARAS